MGESTDSRTTLRFDRRLRLEFPGLSYNLGRGTPGLPRVG